MFEGLTQYGARFADLVTGRREQVGQSELYLLPVDSKHQAFIEKRILEKTGREGITRADLLDPSSCLNTMIRVCSRLLDRP